MRLHHYLFPHRRNKYKPHVFRAASVAFIILGIFVLEGAYLAQIKVIFPKTNFLSAVLPGALITLTNDDRAANGIPAVSQNTQLAQAAQDAANDMATKGYFAHVSPDGKTPWYWLNLVGYAYQYAGENLAVDFTDSSAVEHAWMASPSHQANIIKPQYTDVGIGVANGTYQGKEATFVVQFFGSPAVASSQPAKTTSSSVTSTEASVPALVASVLGAQAQVIATSPTLAITDILSALAIIVFALLIIAIVVKARVQYIEIIAGGLLLLLVIIGLLFFNARGAAKVQVSLGDYSVMRLI